MLVPPPLVPLPLTQSHCIEQRRKELNDLLRNICRLHEFTFIDNDAVGDCRIDINKHICHDGTHLNSKGSEVLGKNFGGVLNDLYKS